MALEPNALRASRALMLTAVIGASLSLAGCATLGPVMCMFGSDCGPPVPQLQKLKADGDTLYTQLATPNTCTQAQNAAGFAQVDQDIQAVRAANPAGNSATNIAMQSVAQSMSQLKSALPASGCAPASLVNAGQQIFDHSFDAVLKTS